MSTITADSVVKKVAGLLVDSGNVGWTRSELLGYLNSGQRAVVILRPEANPVRTVFTLAGGTRQSLPAGGISLIKISRNISQDGVTGANAVRITSTRVLDALNPAWHADATNNVVQEYMYDPEDPLTFWVYPPQPAITPGKVDLLYSATPTDIADQGNNTGPNNTDTISILDIYEPSLLDYMLFRAYSKDSTAAAEAALASMHYQAFLQSLGYFSKEQLMRNPNARNLPFSPAAPNQAAA